MSQVCAQRFMAHWRIAHTERQQMFIRNVFGAEAAERIKFWYPSIRAVSLPLYGGFPLFLRAVINQFGLGTLHGRGMMFQPLVTRSPEQLKRYPKAKQRQLAGLKVWGNKCLEFTAFVRSDDWIVLQFATVDNSMFPDLAKIIYKQNWKAAYPLKSLH